jgi:predicted acylesterase/phospholipase RssA
MAAKQRVGLAFQGGGFPAGAVGAGVVRYLVENGAFQSYDIDVFSGTSAGALVASVCWGHTLRGTIAEAPHTLEKQWLHFAWGLVPDAQVAQMTQLLDAVSRLNPIYEFYSENVTVPLLRQLLQDWVLTYIPIDELIVWRDRAEHVPGLALGAADVLKGTVKVFTEKDFSLEAILASGSIDEVNGLTTIKEGPDQGDYCDGAWGTNPPLTPLIDYGIDELWLVEFFPKERQNLPRTPAERKERKDELWQNSLVDHELYFINKVNEWLASGRLNNADGKYRQLKLKRMPMLLDIPSGAAFVNSLTSIRDMMAYGYEHAKIFLRD